MTKRRLVLLTNQFPYMEGDYPFIQNEIDALAERFDDVIVFNYTNSTSDLLSQLPSNVKYGGNLYGTSRSQKILSLLSPRNQYKLLKILVSDFRNQIVSGHLKGFLAAAAVGMSIAHDARVRDAIGRQGFQTTVYSYWGMGAGLVIPWLDNTVSNVFVRLHRYDLYVQLSGYLPFRQAIFRRVNGILAISDSGRNYLLENYPTVALESKIAVLRLGSINRDSHDASLPAVDEPNMQGNFDAEEIVIVSCSNVSEVKRVHRILDALELVENSKTIRWVHFGGGQLFEKLKAKAEGTTRNGLIIDLRGPTEHERVISFYRSRNVSAFINVSSSEGVPVSIMEAISFDIPVIATSVGGTPEIVGEPFKTGILIPADFTDLQLAETVSDLLDGDHGRFSPRSTWERLYDADINSVAAASYVSKTSR